ncbi:SGNH/GDSL hydrolase family protein [Sansalvadorimonas verongulae]|uniref:SGNH/GDSL hydrolase family protein n=1 Tax=Sansalvadorimonas verongulae TaxID=2172824 RepID=UPI0012BD4341|nr:SGNH/GDSL hydrolase family protein [Sansalvadorimonas verongulae]MTI13520.1 hypothetical protein [Sansalvadorimonas verongulae]
MLQILARSHSRKQQKVSLLWAVFLAALVGGMSLASSGHSDEQRIPIKGLVIFGDSLSDNANTWRLSHYYMGLPDPLNENYETNYFKDMFAGPIPWLVTNLGPLVVPFPVFPTAPYNKGYFSNGPVAVEMLAAYAGLDINNPDQYRNLAFGASWTTSLLDNVMQSWEQRRLPGLRLMFQGKVLPPSLETVTDVYLSHNKMLDPDVVYVIYFNGNDYLNGFSDPSVVASRQFTNIRKLIEAGARHIFWGLVPDYTMSPCFHKGPRRDVVDQWGHEHNSYVRKLAQGVTHAWPQVKLVLGDIGEIFRTVAQDMRQEGGILDSPCVNVYIPGCDRSPDMVSIFNMKEATVCENPDQYLFWDQVHATARVHRIASGYVCRVLLQEGYQLDCPDIEDLKRI